MKRFIFEPSPLTPLPMGEGNVADDLTPTEKIYLPYAQLQEQLRQARVDMMSAWVLGDLIALGNIRSRVHELENQIEQAVMDIHRYVSEKMKKGMQA